MICPATRYTPLPARRARWVKRDRLRATVEQAERQIAQEDKRRFPSIHVPRWSRMPGFRDWMTREMREGGMVQRMLDWEKRILPTEMRTVARRRAGERNNPKSDVRLVASIPARQYFRWKRVDKHFWEDDANLRSYKRDNPDACIFV